MDQLRGAKILEGIVITGRRPEHPQSRVRTFLVKLLAPAVEALLGVAHLVAPTPHAKGKIERRFATFQNRGERTVRFCTVADIFELILNYILATISEPH